MSDERDDADPKEHAKRSLGFLWKAAREAATGIRKEVKQNTVGRAIDDAGREVVRAANNVATRIGVGDILKKVKDRDRPRSPVGKKPTGPTEDDPGFSIAEDDDEEKR